MKVFETWKRTVEFENMKFIIEFELNIVELKISYLH